MGDSQGDDAVLQEVIQALDPRGEMVELVRRVRQLGWRVPKSAREAATEFELLVATVARHWLPLTDRGWGIANVGVENIKAAGSLLESGEAESADRQIAAWFDERWRWRTAARVRMMRDGTPEAAEIYELRADLLEEASALHKEGRYAAAIPIVLAQVEGITAQVTAGVDGSGGKLFFTSWASRQADVVDTTDLASIRASLERLRPYYSAGVHGVQMMGTMSRHGVLHGQEVAYGNELNSARCWSLLDVLVQWAMPRANERLLRVDSARDLAHAGSSEIDERGRRLDTREFKATRNALYEVAAEQSAVAFRTGRFDASQLMDLRRQDLFASKGLPSPHGITVHLEPDGSSWWVERQTISGWWLARALTLNESGHVEVWYYSGPESPAVSPSADPATWDGQPGEAPPDWQGGD